ncbi:ubiquinone/menaquinone biosynthesis C-methylase UbiE [Williamsia limnetica]|jgi:SAM-dependent methyltransferase|uniref:Ubiquinone/menaquinone biosynthesis C-methylase UbiE n=1 Tax=Williamsia limnetica TaxID=882452 RepID=A0A318S227_WILLI|nr:class I SAM-dependent methyltransferase [Williamsia limnetica]PYE20750.1 ubiquinone/menaquinone biosynthesis C-methylase UbiE [Williamsia limnetica]
MTNKTADLASDLKVRHRAMWASGDYPAVATQVIAGLGPTLVEAVGVRAGEVVLDIAAGSGNASIPAAKKGAEVVASDLTPELFDVGRQLAAEERVELSWREADAESLPFADSSFDVVMSCVGVMFAPHHQESADELIRVCRPGGRIGLINWTPTGFIGRMFATMKPYAPAPPPGAQPPPLWGNEEHLGTLFADRISELSTTRQTLEVDRFESGEEFRDFFKATYGPTIAVYRNISGDAEATGSLDQALAALADDALSDGVMKWEYLMVTGVVR